MKRSYLIERLYELNESNEDDEIKSLLYKLIHKGITNEEVEDKLKEIDPSYKRHEFLYKLKNKPVYKTIGEFKNGTLSNIKKAKMVSSLITQILIQLEQDENLSINDLPFTELLDVLQRFSYSEDIDDKSVDEIINKCGWDSEDTNPEEGEED